MSRDGKLFVPQKLSGRNGKFKKIHFGGTYTFDMYHCIVFNNRSHHLYGRGYQLYWVLSDITEFLYHVCIITQIILAIRCITMSSRSDNQDILD